AYSVTGTYVILITVTKAGAGTHQGTGAITVDAAPVETGPTATFSNNGPVPEGSTATVRFADPSVPSGLKYSYDFDNDGRFDTPDSDPPTATVPASFLTDGPATPIVTGRIAGATGHTDYTTAIDITNAPPVAGLLGPSHGVFGQPLSDSFQASDPSP